jgi:Fe-S-cluster containining protein
MQVQAIDQEPTLNEILAIDSEELAERMLEPATMRAIYEDTEEIIGRSRTPDSLYTLVHNAIKTMGEVWANLAEDSEPSACRKGCSMCCHQSVMVTAPEVLLTVKLLRDNLAESEIDQLQARVADRAKEIEGRTTNERMDSRIACAFLVDDICSIYPARPLQCRGGYSEDVEYCRSLFDDRETTQQGVADGSVDGRYMLIPKMLYDSAQVGMAGALKAEGLSADPLEFTAAMAVALADPNITEKWLQGWPVFDGARLVRHASANGDQYITEADGTA